MIEPKICPMSENKKRIAFVDAIKAFTIFCVVYWHILNLCFFINSIFFGYSNIFI